MEKYILQLGEFTWSKVVVGGLIAAGAYWGLYYDNGDQLETAIKALQNNFEVAEKQLKDTKEAMADAEKFEKAVRQNEVQFDKVLEYLPQEINANELTRLVNQQAQLSGPRVQGTKALEGIERKDFYEMTRLDFSIQGSFSQVVLFLSSLSKIQRLLTFDQVKIKTSSTAPNSDNPAVELSGVLVGYRYIKESVDAVDTKGGANGKKP